jgi:signal transduction histidine kinase/ActR/RegA family two-component response regulator
LTPPKERRVLVLVPTHKDAELASSVLAEAGIPCTACPDLEKLAAEIQMGAGAVLIAEEAIPPGGGGPLTAALARRPTWSDLPILVLTRPGADSATVADALRTLGNVVLLERPTRVAALVSAARMALRARRRQYEIRDTLVDLEQATRALREGDRRKDEFLATLAHELRNPLAPIRNALAVLRSEAAVDPEHPEKSELFGIMERQVEHMVRLVDDLMEVSRITRGKIELRKTRLDLAVVLTSAVETSRPLVEAGGHRLSVALPPLPIEVDGDFVRLTQVFANLLNNAAKYTDHGGSITLTAQCEDDEVVVSVRDTGIGIPADLLPRVFEMFVQVDRGAGGAQGGLGIGLALARTLIEMHGGSVEARSEGVGHGSEFLVRLPVAVSAVTPAESPTTLLPPSRRRVLVADDNRDAADSLATLLRRMGVETCVVYGGREALEAAVSWRPDLALLDVGMPDMDGCEVARAVRARSELQSVFLVALTGWSQREDRRRTRAAGFDEHIVKPAEARALRALLAPRAGSCFVEG